MHPVGNSKGSFGKILDLGVVFSVQRFADVVLQRSALGRTTPDSKTSPY